MGDVCDTHHLRQLCDHQESHPETKLIASSEFADMHPSAAVIGTDLSPIQPAWVPPNVQFEIDDCCDEWVYQTSFDFVHVRGLYGCVADWDPFYTEALR